MLPGGKDTSVVVGNTHVTQGPHIESLSAAHDIHIATEQTIHAHGDTIRVGDVFNSSNIAIGHGANIHTDDDNTENTLNK